MINQMSPAQFAERRESGELWQLLDVREPWEVEIAAVAGSVNIPMQEIMTRHTELNRELAIAVLCHSGVRSAGVAMYLAASGFGTVVNIDGGIDAWSLEVDSSVPRY